MAKQKQKAVQRQSITSHQLFPAVVGLWFGALFGLGSLAVRPSLIEDMVLSSRIDLIVPAAAPPLGITARIMLALVMAALGTILGVVLARRLTRPKADIKERTRDLRGGAAPTRQRSRDTHPDAPSCRPISMQDIESSDNVQSGGPLSGRRRPLTIDHDAEQFVPQDFAPLPGGGEPQVEELSEIAPSPAHAAAMQPPPVAEMAAVVSEIALQARPNPTTPNRQVFQNVPAAQPELAAENAAAHADGRQVFGMEPAKPQAEQPRQIFGLAADGDHLPQEFVREAGYKTSVFETEVHQPLFERGPVDQQTAPTVGAAFIEPIPEPALAPVSVAAFAVPAAPEQPAAEVPAPQSAAPALEPLPSPASLGMTDLAERLAESMRRRRAARDAAATQPAVVDLAPSDQVLVAPSLVQPAPMHFAQPEPYFATAVEAPAEPDMADPAPAHPAPAQETPVQFATSVEPEQEPEAVVAPPVDAMPSSLRPLALDAFLEEDLDFDASLLPPRRLVPEAPVATETPAPIQQPFVAESFSEPAEAPIAEENYASLLGIGGQRTGFVRIEEPEADAFAPEPVVIFPGQAPLGQAQPFTPPVFAAPLDDGASLRRFDSPAAAEQGQPIDLGTSASGVAPDEAAQALRTALASLQRISGAA